MAVKHSIKIYISDILAFHNRGESWNPLHEPQRRNNACHGHCVRFAAQVKAFRASEFAFLICGLGERAVGGMWRRGLA